MTAEPFLLFAGPPAAVVALTRALNPAEFGAKAIEPRLSLPGFTLFAARDATIHILPRDTGFVLGRLHARIDGSRLTELTARDAEEAVTTLGGSLLASFWGSYVAAIVTGDGHAVLRDPAGAIPVYCAQRREVHVYASRSDAILPIVSNIKTDLRFVAHWLAYPYLRTATTGIAGIIELLPGCRRIIAGRSTPRTEALWSPWDHAASERQILDFDRAAGLLRERLMSCVPASAQSNGKLLLELSGGLDSGIVAACLANAGVPFDAVNFVTASADGDERRYAQAMAAKVGATLTELFEEQQPADLSVPRPALRPGLSPLVMPLHRIVEAHAAEAKADALATGAGGDNIFCYLTTAAPIVDAWLCGGLSTALRTIGDVARLNGCTWWTALRLALAKGRRKPHDAGWRGGNEFVNPEAVPQRDPHPWLEAPKGALPGKREHVSSLLLIQHMLDPDIRSGGRPSVHPLMSQPLIELCLRIPSWLWCSGGRNRAVARHALRALLAPDVLRRSTKGRLEGMCGRAFLRSRGDVRELLLDGRLADHHLLDRTKVAAYFSEEPSAVGSRYFRIMELAASELWLRSVE